MTAVHPSDSFRTRTIESLPVKSRAMVPSRPLVDVATTSMLISCSFDTTSDPTNPVPPSTKILDFDDSAYTGCEKTTGKAAMAATRSDLVKASRRDSSHDEASSSTVSFNLRTEICLDTLKASRVGPTLKALATVK